jgi:hypothetical protein
MESREVLENDDGVEVRLFLCPRSLKNEVHELVALVLDSVEVRAGSGFSCFAGAGTAGLLSSII